MTQKTAAILLIACLPAALTGLHAQEVVYVIPAAASGTVSGAGEPEAVRRLNSASFPAIRRESGLQTRRGLWRRRSRSDLYANVPAGARSNIPAAETDARPDGADYGANAQDVRGNVRGVGRSAAETADDARSRRILYSHRVREGGVLDPYAPLGPDGRNMPRPVRSSASGAAGATIPALNSDRAANIAASQPRSDNLLAVPDAPRRAIAEPGSEASLQPASDAETFNALNSSIGATGTDNSLFVDGAMATVSERSQGEWDSLGIRSGAFILRPSASLETEFSDNVTMSEKDRKSDVAAVLRASFSADSNWSRHALSASVSTEITRYAKVTNENDVAVNAALLGRIDVRRHSSIDVEARYGQGREASSSTSSSASATRRAMISTYHASVRGNQRFNRLTFSLRGAIDYNDYGKSLLSGGSSASNDDRDYGEMSASLRTTYDIKPGMSVYTEGGVSLRRHDMRIDASGIKRNSNGFYAEMGTRFEISRLIRADAALGVVHRDYEDNSLKDVTALTARGQLAWNVTKLTTVTAEVSTDIGETDQAGTSASIERQTALGIQHELLRNVILSGELRGAFNKAAGGTTKETAFSATLNAEYKLNRNSTLTATAVRTQRDSNQTGGDYVENTLRLGLNLKL